MIKINWDKKLKKIGYSSDDFELMYIEKILNHRHKVTHSKVSRTPKNKDRFNLYSNLTSDQLEQHKDKYIKLEDLLFKHYSRSNPLRTYIDNNFRSLQSIADSRSLLREILLMKPHDILSKVNSSRTPADIKSLLTIIFNYDRDRASRIKYAFEKLNFKVCIYCNRNYISNYTKSKKSIATFNLDHFHQKEKYPIFALSLYNLIPSCSVCNTSIKNTQDLFHYNNPHSDNYDFHNLAKFKLSGINGVKLVSHNSECKKYISDFKINEIYSIHNSEVQDIITRRRIFSDNQIKNLSKLTKISSNRIKSALFGDIIYNNDLDQESLAKLKIDLAKELNII